MAAANLFTPDDLRYIRTNFTPLAEVAETAGIPPTQLEGEIEKRRLPAPSYVVEGTGYVPRNYLQLIQEGGGFASHCETFAQRFVAAGGDPSDTEVVLRGYLNGTYGVCLKVATPENILRKGHLVDQVSQLLKAPQPEEQLWAASLVAAVEELDSLEQPFSPHFDRNGRFPQPPTRDRLITHTRERFPHLFARGASG